MKKNPKDVIYCMICAIIITIYLIVLIQTEIDNRKSGDYYKCNCGTTEYCIKY